MKRVAFLVVAAGGMALAGLELRHAPPDPETELMREARRLLLESNPEDSPLASVPVLCVHYTYTDEALALSYLPSRPRWLSHARRMIGIADADDDRWISVELMEDLCQELKK